MLINIPCHKTGFAHNRLKAGDSCKGFEASPAHSLHREVANTPCPCHRRHLAQALLPPHLPPQTNQPHPARNSCWSNLCHLGRTFTTTYAYPEPCSTLRFNICLQEAFLISQLSYGMMEISKLSGRQQSPRQPWCHRQHSCKDQLPLLEEQVPQRSARSHRVRAQMTTG